MGVCSSNELDQKKKIVATERVKNRRPQVPITKFRLRNSRSGASATPVNTATEVTVVSR